MELEPLGEPGDTTRVEKGITELKPFEEAGDMMGVREIRRTIKTSPEKVAEVEIRGAAGDASPGKPLDESGDNNTQVNYHIY